VTPWLITTFAPAVGQRVIRFLLSLPRHPFGVAAAMAGLLATSAGVGVVMYLHRLSGARKGSAS
jgi:hypothetical protein